MQRGAKGGFTDPVNDNIIAFDPTQITHPENRSNPQPGDPAPTLAETSHPLSIADVSDPISASEQGTYTHEGNTFRLHNVNFTNAMRPRRLTPRECERLQGFPDDWTLVGNMKDGPRYRMLGNAVTVNVAEWLGQRIMEVAG